jgi:hypothetical protein
MDQNKSQHYNYTHESIPIVWHKQTEDFLRYLDRDGKKFLEFYWKHLTENLGVQVKSSFAGMSYEIEDVPDKSGQSIKIVKLILPPPTNIGEVYFMALVKMPKKTTVFDLFLTHLPSTYVYSLEYQGADAEGVIKTDFCELTPHARNIRIGVGCAPDLTEFMKLVKTRLKLPVVEETK